MASPGYAILLLVSLHLTTVCYAAPLSNETISAAVATAAATDSGLREGSCTLGDVVYMGGDEWGGSSPCERCRCSGGAVSCAREHCEPRPGCKALHRPDQCCPIYQCECEQEGRIYGNGEKLVDPKDPCRVCYCQGGEVVCRRIACFVRDDCRPRAVPGRCCPEYDNCPLRGVTTLPGVAAVLSNVTSTTQLETSAATLLPQENVKQEVTIKEITPVFEVPVMTDVKIKEILPSTSVEVTEFTSSKSPVIVREATSEKSLSTVANVVTETPAVIEIQPSSTLISTALPTKSSEISLDTKTTADSSPSKVSFSTQDSINTELYLSPTPVNETPAPVSLTTSTSTTKTPVVEEEDPTIVEHNPAFPPIPDDLSVVGNHEEDTMTEQNIDGEHVSDAQDMSATHTSSTIPDMTATKENNPTMKIGISEKSNSSYDVTAQTVVTETIKELTKSKESPMLNLRSAIPSEILNAPSALPEDITGELDEVTESFIPDIRPATFITSTSTQHGEKNTENTTSSVTSDTIFTTSQIQSNSNTDFTDLPLSTDQDIISSSVKSKIDTLDYVTTLATTTYVPPQRRKEIDSTTDVPTADTTQATFVSSSRKHSDDFTFLATGYSTTVPNQEQKIGTTSKVLPEITSQTEFSSLPIETSDQNPQDSISKDKNDVSTLEAYITDMPKIYLTFSETGPVQTIMTTEGSVDNLATTNRQTAKEKKYLSNVETLTDSTRIFIPLPEIQLVHKEFVENPQNRFYTEETTTEIITNNFGLSEVVTEDVELLKISTESGKSAAIVTQSTKKPNFMNDLNDLVGDIVSIGDSNDTPVKDTPAPTLPNSEELIPFNAGYKSKNNNWNVNSISEVPPKIKSQNSSAKQKIEIEEDEYHITDSSPPYDKVEPTTRRPIIDNVSNDPPENKTSRTDIEILTQSYVPSLNRKPTKVVMKKNQDKISNASEYESSSVGMEISSKVSKIINSESITSTSKHFPVENTSTTIARIIETTTGVDHTTRILDVSTSTSNNLVTKSQVPSTSESRMMESNTREPLTSKISTSEPSTSKPSTSNLSAGASSPTQTTTSSVVSR